MENRPQQLCVPISSMKIVTELFQPVILVPSLRDNPERTSTRCSGLELSSYQLELIEDISADVIIFTSFSSDHLERHKTLEKYFDVKWSLVKKSDIPLILSDQVIRYVDTRGINVKNTLTVFDNSNTINFNFNHIAKAKHNYLNGSMSLAA